jgi:hypothetical protein
MRYIKIPAPATAAGRVQDNTGQLKDVTLFYTFEGFLEEHVFPSPLWRSDWADSFMRLEPLWSAQPGDIIGIDDVDHACLVQLLLSAKIAGKVARKLMYMIHAITKADVNGYVSAAPSSTVSGSLGAS